MVMSLGVLPKLMYKQTYDIYLRSIGKLVVDFLLVIIGLF